MDDTSDLWDVPGRLALIVSDLGHADTFHSRLAAIADLIHPLAALGITPTIEFALGYNSEDDSDVTGIYYDEGLGIYTILRFTLN